MIDISVIMACYNKSKYIHDAINSVLNQTFQNWELIVVNDASTDNSFEIAKHFETDKRIVLIDNVVNNGANYCRNQALNIAKGKYIVFLDADDLLHKTCLENRFKRALQYIDAQLLVFTMGVFYKKIGDDNRLWRPISKHPLKDFLQHNLPWSILQPFWKRELLLTLNGFDLNFKRLQDVELNTRALLSSGFNYRLFNETPDCYYRIDEERKNFDAYKFLEKWVDSAILFVEKFSGPAKQLKIERCLNGTIYSTYVQTLYQHRTGNISAEEVLILEKKLEININKRNAYFDRFLYRSAKYYHLYLPRIPGLNKLIKSLLVI